MNSATNQLELLSWDSDFLGYPVARLTAQAISAEELTRQVAAARAAGVRVIYVIAEPADETSNTSAAALGAWLADRKVTFAMPVDPTGHSAVLPAAICPTTTWTPELESLALQSGEYSRFRLDTHFEPDVFSRLYKQWLRNSLAHQIAREVLAFEQQPGLGSESAKALGLLTLGLKNNRADIGLLAVDEHARGQRIGQQLVAAARQRTAAWGLPELQVVTQLDNEPACGFYQRCGFREWRVEHVYHLWV